MSGLTGKHLYFNSLTVFNWDSRILWRNQNGNDSRLNYMCVYIYSVLSNKYL